MTMFNPNQAMGSGTPSDFAAEQDSILRRRKLLDAMAGGAMSAPIVGNSKGMAIGQGLLKVLTAYLGSKSGAAMDAEQAALGAKQRESLTGELGNYMKIREGAPGQTMSDADAANLMQNDVAPNLAEPVKADPRAALLTAMTSQHPEMQRIGQADMAAQLAAGKQKGYKDHMTQDGSMVRVFDSGEVKPLGNFAKPKDQWSDPYEIRGTDNKPLMVKRNLATNEIDVVDKAPKVTANASANSSSLTKGQTAGMEQWAKLAGKATEDMTTAARSAQGTLRTLDQLQKINETGIPGGPLAGASVFLQNLAQQTGIPIDKTKLANAEDFNSIATQTWMEFMNQAGGARGLVKEESEKIANALPSLMQSPAGRQQVINTMRAVAQQKIDDAREAQRQFGTALKTEDPNVFTFGLSNTQVPPTPNTLEVPRPASGGGTPRVKNW